ncbi:MAG TPA: alpha/beta hydrolase [Acidimicrobiales bacterium]|nr:alpha/beta hydrolase [Acidimicrobiales bacterium]
MVEVKRDFVEMSHGRTRYFEAGEGEPVLLVHGAGFLSGGDGWLPVLPGLGERFHVYALDCLNFGPGDHLEQEFSFAYLVDHLREFQDVMGLESSHLVGHSMGGWLGVLLAYESPNRVRRFVDIAGGGAATRNLTTMVAWQPPPEEDVRAAVERYAGSNISSDVLLEERLAMLHDEQTTAAFRRLMDHMTNPETRTRYNTLRRLPHISSPTLVVWGSEDKVNALELGEQTAQLIPDAKLVVYEGIGHNVPYEAPARLVETITEFLA